MSWTSAQRYYKEHYTDLASVRNIAEDKIKMLEEEVSWKWSDG